MSVRLIAIDIDGTLLDSQGRLPPGNRDAIAEALARGVNVVLVTGRSHPFAVPIARQLGPQVVVLSSNGAIGRSTDGRTFYRRLLARATAARLLEHTETDRTLAALVFDRPEAGHVVFERMDWSDANRRGYYERNQVYLSEVRPLAAALREDPVQVMFNGPVDAVRRVDAALRASIEADTFTSMRTEYPHRDFALLDLLAPGCSKGSGLAAWAARAGIPASAVMAIGDNLNDHDMLAFAGVAVAMGNAVPELAALGCHRTSTNDELGVAEAIYRWALG